jgi:hypothetical protein
MDTPPAIEADLFWHEPVRVRMWSGTHERHNAMLPLPSVGSTYNSEDRHIRLQLRFER